MAFFKDLRRQPVSPETPYFPPIWTGPSEQELAGLVSIRKILARGREVVVTLDALRAYSNGFELHFHIATQTPLFTDVFAHRVPPWTTSDGPLRLGYELADGRVASDEDIDPALVPRDADGLPYVPVFIVAAGPVRRYSFAVIGWCWPLPPPGPLTIYAEWRERGIAETVFSVDGTRSARWRDSTCQSQAVGSPLPGAVLRTCMDSSIC